MAVEVEIDSDLGRVRSFLGAIEQHFVPPLGQRVDLDRYAEKLSRYAVNAYLVDEGGDLAHAAVYVNDTLTRVAYLSSFGVLPVFYGTGLSHRLLAATLDVCRKAAMRSIRLEVHDRNVAAVRFYERAGFEKKGDHDGYVAMERILGGPPRLPRRDES